MRLTQTLLKEYVEADALIKKLEARKSEIKETIRAQEKTEFTMGDFLVKIISYTRVIPLPVEKIREILKTRADEVLREAESQRIEVKRVS